MNFEIWKTIKLGTGLKTGDDFLHTLKEGGFDVKDGVLNMLENPDFTTAVGEKEIDLIKVSYIELGFKNDVPLDQKIERAKELGLEPCPPEVGPQLRLQHKDQPNGEVIWVAMKPIIGSDGSPSVFGVGRLLSSLWLRGQWSPPGDVFWFPGGQFVFVRPRK